MSDNSSVWQLHRSRQEAEMKREQYDTASFCDTLSVSQIVTDTLPLSVFLSLTHSVGIYCDFRAKEESREDRGSLEDEKPPTACQWKPVELTPHFAPKKGYFQWALCIMRCIFFLKCGCRHVSQEVILEAVRVVYLGIGRGTWRLQWWPDAGVARRWAALKEAFPREATQCDLFSSGGGSLYPKGHCSSALSPERTELIIHAHSYNNQTTKDKPDQPLFTITLRMKHVELNLVWSKRESHSETPGQVIVIVSWRGTNRRH